MKYKHILFATDLSDVTDSLVAKIKSLCADSDAQLTLVHTIEPIPAYGYPAYGELESSFIDEARQKIAQVADKLGISKTDQRIEFGSVKHEVLRLADELKVDLIVVGSHGRHGLSRLLGSSASAIIHGAKCDVLTIRVES